MHQTTPEEARRQIMIGGKQECLDTIERYAAPASPTSSSCCSRPYFLEDLQAFAEEVMPAAKAMR